MNHDSSLDRRVQRTRRTLREALISLILERGWDEIGIQELCERADVGRSTFYMHFANKEELLTGSFDDLRKGIQAQAAASPKSSADGLVFVRGMIEHAHEQQKLFRALVGRRGGYFVHARFRQVIVELVKEELRQRKIAGWKLDASAHYIGGAFVDLMSWWLEARRPQSPDEIEKLFHQLTAPVLRAIKTVDESG